MRYRTDKFVSVGIRPWGLLSAAAGMVCIGTVAGFLGRLWWIFELASHFRAQYFLFLLACGFLFLIGKRRWPAILTGVFALINLSLIIPLYIAGSFAHSGDRMLRAMLINVNLSNRAYGTVRTFIRSLDPDFIVVVEVTPRWMNELEKMQADYPFSRGLRRSDNFGVALFSRMPFANAQIQHIGQAEVPSVVARFDIDGEPLTIIGTHLYPPKNKTFSTKRNQQLAELAHVVSSHQGFVMVLADLNTTSWSPFFQDLLRKTGLRDSRMGFGLQPTWPTENPLLWVPIDHCLVSSGIAVHNRRIGPHIGSDHYPVVVDFSVESRKARSGQRR